MLPHAGNGFSM
jgi:hypothetical protein